MRPKIAVLLLLILIIACTPSCKKKKNISPSDIRIARIDLIHYQSIQHYNIVYNSQNNVDSIVSIGGGTDTGHNGYKYFTYSSYSYLVTNESGIFYRIQTNSSGMMTEALTTDTLFITYNGSEATELDDKIPSVTYPFYTTSTSTFQWKNGDIVSIKAQNATDSIFYDGSRPGQQGDALRINEFLNYGQSYTKSTHLPKEIDVKGTWVQKYFYQFDGSGRISQFMQVINNNSVVSDDTLIYNYRY